MARKPQRDEQVTVAELLVRSAAAHSRYRFEDTVVLPRARHREESPLVQERPFSLAKTRVVAVVAGALTLAGGMSAAMSPVVGTGPIDRSSEAVWPPLDLTPASPTHTPSPADVAGSAGRSSAHSPVTAPDSDEQTPDGAGNGIDLGALAPDSGKDKAKPEKDQGKGLGLGLAVGDGNDNGNGKAKGKDKGLGLVVGDGNGNANGNGKAKGKNKDDLAPPDAGVTVNDEGITVGIGDGTSSPGGGSASTGGAAKQQYTLQMPKVSRYASVGPRSDSRSGSHHHSDNNNCGGGRHRR